MVNCNCLLADSICISYSSVPRGLSPPTPCKDEKDILVCCENYSYDSFIYILSINIGKDIFMI